MRYSEPMKNKIEINGKQYRSVLHAHQSLGVSREIISKWFRDIEKTKLAELSFQARIMRDYTVKKVSI